jgi:hypothetical protein
MRSGGARVRISHGADLKVLRGVLTLLVPRAIDDAAVEVASAIRARSHIAPSSAYRSVAWLRQSTTAVAIARRLRISDSQSRPAARNGWCPGT